MTKYMKLMAVKGLIMSMDEQLYQHFQKDNLPENVKNIIVKKYYDAILEQFDEPEKMKEDQAVEHAFYIIINGKKHFMDTPDDNKKIDWVKVVFLSGLAKTGKEILTITYHKGVEEKPEGVLDVTDLVKIKSGMIFNVCNTSKGE